MVGRTIGKYRIVGQLGRGGMGTVYKAIDETLDREVAIKVLNPELAETDVMKRFRAEATTLAKLNHPEIATIYELFRSETDLLMVMEFVRGETLDKISERLGPMAPERAAFLIDKVLSALEHAHRAGVVHRDMKPANVMVTDIGGVKIMDFGIARVRGAEHMTVDGYMMGTPAYMPPEQVLGQEVDGRADLYSVGVVFYRLLTGALPFKADTAIGMVQKQISEAPTPLHTHRAGLPSWCETVLLRALAKSPADRYQTAEDFRTAISHATGMSTSIEHAKSFANADIEATTPPQPVVLEKLGLTPIGVSHPAGASPSPPTAVALSTPPVPLPAPPAASVSPAFAATPVAMPLPPPPPVSPAPTSGPNVEGATIVLRKQHFAVAGSLLAILALGVAILAYVALRRPVVTPAVVTAPPPSNAAPSTSTPGSSTPSTPETATPSNPGTTPQPSGTPPTSTPPTSTGTVAVATPGPSPVAPVNPVNPGPKPSGPSASAGATSAGGTTPAGTGSTTKVPATDPASSSTSKPAPPARAALPVATFEVKAFIDEGTRSRERDARMILAEGKVTVTADDNQDSLHSIPYDSVLSINYSTGRNPQWQSPEGPKEVARAGSGFLGIRGDRHWVLLQTKDAKDPFVILRFLNPSTAKNGLKALEERTGHHTENITERKDAK